MNGHEIINHGVNGWHLTRSDGRTIASLDAGVHNQLVQENLQRQKKKNPNASWVRCNEDELQEAIEAQIRRLCNVPDGARLVNTINQSTMVFQPSA